MEWLLPREPAISDYLRVVATLENSSEVEAVQMVLGSFGEEVGCQPRGDFCRGSRPSGRTP